LILKELHQKSKRAGRCDLPFERIGEDRLFRKRLFLLCYVSETLTEGSFRRRSHLFWGNSAQGGILGGVEPFAHLLHPSEFADADIEGLFRVLGGPGIAILL
jgi:hypothetical protein